MTSILICRFIISLRKFDSRTICVTSSSEIGGHLPAIELAARPSDTLPSFLVSFSHPVHVHQDCPDTDSGSEAGFFRPTVVLPASNLVQSTSYAE